MSQLLEDETLNLYAGEYQLATVKRPFLLEGGEKLTNGVLAYETYGALNSEKDNAILVFHALSGSQHAAGFRESLSGSVDRLWTFECKIGWWDKFIGKNNSIIWSELFYDPGIYLPISGFLIILIITFFLKNKLFKK